MGYSIIPKTVNVDNITIDKNASGEIEINSPILREISQNILNLNILGVENNSNMINANDFSEYYFDVNGLNNSVDTINTNSQFNLNKYYQNKSLDVINSHGIVNNGWSTVPADYKTGIYMLATKNTFISSVQKFSTSGGTQCKIYSNSGTLLGTANFLNNIALFDTGIQINNGSYYSVVVTNPINPYSTVWNNPTPTYPQNSTDLNYVNSSAGANPPFNNNNLTIFYDIEKINTTLNPITETSIYHNMNLSQNPNIVFLIAFDELGKKINVGNYTFKLYDGINTTIEYLPNILNNITGLNGTPNKLILIQKSNVISKISRIVSLFN